MYKTYSNNFNQNRGIVIFVNTNHKINYINSYNNNIKPIWKTIEKIIIMKYKEKVTLSQIIINS
jgi:hypothetical protein